MKRRAFLAATAGALAGLRPTVTQAAALPGTCCEAWDTVMLCAGPDGWTWTLTCGDEVIASGEAVQDQCDPTKFDLLPA
jgi:hypothetical protein